MSDSFDPLAQPAHPAATGAADGDASLAPLPPAGGDDGSAVPPAAGGVGKLPTPARTVRHNEWTRARMAGFLRELAASQSVSQAAKSVGMGRQSAYRLRNKLAGTPFALAWEVALEAGLQQLAHAVLDRAVNGEEVPHYYHGELVATHRKYDNRLAAWLLDNPWKVGRQQVAREYVAHGFDALLERIEWDNLDWVEGEPLPGKGPWPPADASEALEDEGRFIGKSWYMAEAAFDEKRGGRARR